MFVVPLHRRLEEVVHELGEGRLPPREQRVGGGRGAVLGPEPGHDVRPVHGVVVAAAVLQVSTNEWCIYNYELESVVRNFPGLHNVH